jgi:uncharacterized protein YlxW (UPF0749 family)
MGTKIRLVLTFAIFISFVFGYPKADNKKQPLKNAQILLDAEKRVNELKCQLKALESKLDKQRNGRDNQTENYIITNNNSATTLVLSKDEFVNPNLDAKIAIKKWNF